MLAQAVQGILAAIGLSFDSLLLGSERFWLPARGSNHAVHVDQDWEVVFWMCAAFFALVTFLLVFFMLRYRKPQGADAEGGSSHNTPLEVFWSVVPTLLVVVLFWQGFTTYLDLATPPQNAYEIQVGGQKWNWYYTYQYPDGAVVTNELHVPVGEPIRLVMKSDDVIHSFYVPEFRVKRDVIPGRYTKLWFTPTQIGEYDVFCAEYCGTDHSKMLSRVVVEERADFEAWLEKEATAWKEEENWAEVGEQFYLKSGCPQCHSIDGTIIQAPSFLGLWGSVENLADGSTVTVDENYVMESIYEPMAKVTAGYEPIMPTYKGRLNDEKIARIIEFLKTLQSE